MKPLQTFYSNEHEREAVKSFMIDTLAQLAVDRAFAGKPTTGIAEAKECIDDMFNKLDEMFTEQKPINIPNSR